MAPAKPVNVQILDKEYTVSCEDGEREALYSAVDYLNARMEELREGGRIIGHERIAVMAALNITHEFLAYKARHDTKSTDINAAIHRIQDKIRNALESKPAAELSDSSS